MDGMKFPNKFVENIYKANKVLGKVESVLSIALLWALIVVCMIFISCRFIFHYSTPWADELARYLLIILAWFGGSYAASVGDHLEIDIVSTVLKKRTKNADKILAVIDRIGQVVVLGVMVFLSAMFLLLHTYALSAECVVVLLLAYIIVLVIYLRFAPKAHLLLLLTPLLFVWKIPYAAPLAAGLFGTPGAAAAVAGGVVVYYVLAYITGNAQAFGGGESDTMLQRFSDMGTGVIENKEMLIVVTAFAITAILVYAIRRMSINYSRAIAVLVGTLADIVILLIGDLIYDANFSLAGVILGSIVCALIALVMQFFQFNLDYARTEKVQFEDDEYYYYVKAVPKMAVAVPEKRVKRITTQRANQNVRHSHGKGKTRK